MARESVTSAGAILINISPMSMHQAMLNAAGDITRSAHNVTWASADGVTAAVALHRSLVF